MDKKQSGWTTENVKDAARPGVKVSTTAVCVISDSERRKEMLRMEMERVLFWE